MAVMMFASLPSEDQMTLSISWGSGVSTLSRKSNGTGPVPSNSNSTTISQPYSPRSLPSTRKPNHASHPRIQRQRRLPSRHGSPEEERRPRPHQEWSSLEDGGSGHHGLRPALATGSLRCEEGLQSLLPLL